MNDRSRKLATVPSDADEFRKGRTLVAGDGAGNDTRETTTLQREYQPRYVAYAEAHGRSPDDQIAHDFEAYPGGCMCGFIVWISTRIAAFHKKHPEAFIARDTLHDHGAFTRYLQEAGRNRITA